MPEVHVLTARKLPLGGPRSMSVRRTLPHPHTGLQTGSWLCEVRSSTATAEASTLWSGRARSTS